MADAPEERMLTLDRHLAAPPAAVWRCWSEPELMARWFAPAPWSVAKVELDTRAGGSTLVVMRSPDGTEHPGRGVYLEVVPGEKLVFTDAYVRAWEPSAKPFMTAQMTLAPDGDGTRYRVEVRHWTVEDTHAHEAMGFHAGWNQCADQLEALAASL